MLAVRVTRNVTRVVGNRNGVGLSRRSFRSPSPSAPVTRW
jgi:hypothetical protein